MQDNRKKSAVSAERSIDFTRLGRVLLKRLWIIVLIAVLCAVMVFGYTKVFVAPVYRSSFTAYVNNRITTTEGQANMTSSDITASRNLTYLYQEIILSRSVLTDAAAACGLQASYVTLAKNVSTSVSANAAIITVYVSAGSPEAAERLATAIASVAPDYVARIVDGSSMRIVDQPIMSTSPYAPNAQRSALMGFFAVLLAGCVCVIAFDLIVDKVASATEMEERYDIAVIGIIPDMLQADKHQSGRTDSGRRRQQ